MECRVCPEKSRGQVARWAGKRKRRRLTFTENPLRCFSLFLSHKDVSLMLDEVWSPPALVDAPCHANLGRLHMQHRH